MQSVKTNRVFIVFSSLIVTVLIIEGVLRFLGWGFLYLQERRNKEPVLSAGIELDEAEDIQLSHTGKKEFVVLCIGESTTAFGGRNSWPSQLQRVLNNIQDQRTFRVINKGIPDAITDAILEKVPSWLNEYRPDFVLAMVGINDNVESVPEKTSSSQFQWAAFLSNFRTYDLIEWIVSGVKVRVTERTEDMTTPNVVGEDDDNSKSVIYGLRRDGNDPYLHTKTIRNLNDMVNLTTDRGINFVFVQYVLRETDILRNVIENKNVVYISNYENFLDLLKQHNYDELFEDNFAGDFGHTTSFGNRVIADNVAKQLLKLLALQEQSN